MDFSVNNRIKRTNNTNFQGLKGAFDKLSNQQVFQFILPKLNQGEKAVLQVVFLEKDPHTLEYIQPDPKKIISQDFDSDSTTLDLLQNVFKNNAKHGAFAYRYDIVNNKGEHQRYVIDEARKISVKGEENGFMNVIDMGKSYGVTPKGGAMRHSFLDSDGVLKNGALNHDPSFVRNHFNKLGGNIKGLNYLLEYTTVLDPYRYIITTPDIGVDPISSHKYWPCNQYQCSDINAFKEFNFNLFKKGKGYVADGAFTSQGIQSPMVHHILKWGEDSPFYHMLKVDGNLELGVLPDRGAANPSGAYGHIGVKIINSPEQEGYNSKKPTYMQFFDDRLSSEAQRKENALISSYDSQPDDHYEIVNHQDSVQPYYFELDPDRDASKIAKFGKSRTIMLTDDKIKNNLGDFLTFDNFKIVSKQDAKGATYWAGNRDIIKMNLSNPTSETANKQGLKNARNYLYGVASFWSEAIQSELILKTAMESNDSKEAIAKNNNIDIDFIEKILKDTEALDDMHYMVLEQNKTVQDYVQEFPLQSIETSLELSAIFSQPQFQQEFLSGKTKENLVQIVDSAIKKAIPDRYKNDAEYKTYATKAYANAILKYVLAGAMNPDTVKNGSIDYSKLKNVTLKSFQSFGAPSTVEEERKQVISKIKSGIKADFATDISKKIKGELANISLEDFKRAELIVEQGKGGLNWRFDAAKDIGDLDSLGPNTTLTFADIWDGDDKSQGVVQFWANFIDNIHKYNPASYVVSEITDLWSYCNKPNFPHENFDKHWESLLSGREIQGTGELPYVKEMQFLESTNSTTSSNYNNYYNNLMQFIGVNPEHGNTKGGENNKGNLEALKGQVDKIINNAQPNTIMLTHMFTDNHDKPRLLHAIPLDRDLYLRGTLDGYRFDKEQMEDLLGKDFKPEDANHISSKAYAVGIFIREAINNNGYDNDKKAKLMASLRNLVLGKKDDSSPRDFRRAEAFGTLPYEVTVRDMFKNAGINDEQEVENFTWNLIKNSAWKEERLTQVMNAIVGVPTIYNGAEYAQTGFESPSKNMFVGNRGQILHNFKIVGRNSQEELSGTKQERKDYYNKVSANMAMSQIEGLSALRDGHTMSLKLTNDILPPNLNGINKGAFYYYVNQIKGKDTTALQRAINERKEDYIGIELTNLGIQKQGMGCDNHVEFMKNPQAIIQAAIDAATPSSDINVWPIYKYNEKGSGVISIVSSLNLDGGSGTVKEVPAIRLRTSQGECPIPEGTKFKRLIYKPEKGKYDTDKNSNYVVKGGFLVNAKQGESVELNDTVTTFYIENDNS